MNVLDEERKLKHYLGVSLEPRARQMPGIRVLPYREFLDSLWDNGSRRHAREGGAGEQATPVRWKGALEESP